MKKPWLKHYPAGVAFEIDHNRYASVNELFAESVRKYRDRAAFINLGVEMSFEDLDCLTAEFASYLQNVAGLKKGDRLAIQMPNLLQYPVAMYGALRAGVVVVNTNPLYTARELKHQLEDSGATAIVVLANSAHVLAEVVHETKVKTVIVTEVGDLLGFPKRPIVNAVVKYVRKMVPSYSLPGHLTFNQALDLGRDHRFEPVATSADDLAFLQYTGGTTGVAKGAMLTHRNIISNMLQIAQWMQPRLVLGGELAVLALPLYHIFSLTVNALAMLYYGGTNLMITNPRDMNDFTKILRSHPFTVFIGLNTLFNGLMNHPDFDKIDFSHLKISVAGGMALQRPVAERWNKSTNTRVVEGYGLTECSPVASCNPIDDTDKIGTIGLPLPSTEIGLFDEDGNPSPAGQSGEIWIRGPQVMQGYWNNQTETDKMITKEGWLKSGDVGVFDEAGFVKIVDRIKDMILVSGFNVYPNEIEEVVAAHPKVLEVAAVGVPDQHSNEVVKIFVVKRDPSLTEEELRAFCKLNLTGYKMPRQIEFRAELPKTNVGKILRRALRNTQGKSA